MSSDMPLIAPAARASDSVAVASMPQLQSKPFFASSIQSEWVTTSGMPPGGAWQLAPQGVVNPFVLGRDRLYGDAAYTTKDRKMRRANEPEVISLQPTVVQLHDDADGTNTNQHTGMNPLLVREGTLCYFDQNKVLHLLVRTEPYTTIPNMFVKGVPALGGGGDLPHYMYGVVAADTLLEKFSTDESYTNVPIIVAGEAAININGYTTAQQTEMLKVATYHLIGGRIFFRTLRGEKNGVIYGYIF